MGRLTISNAMQELAAVDQASVELFKHGSLSVKYYQPEKVDAQQPHTRDEVYVIASGKGFFVNSDKRQAFETGEVLFVPAGVVHRFEEISDDFATWVIFYGPEGGESTG